MPYAGQEGNDSEISLLPGEIPGLIFTEKDRRIAREAIKEVNDGFEPDPDVSFRLHELMTVGNSFQAQVLLVELLQIEAQGSETII